MSDEPILTLDEMREFFAREFLQNPVLIDEATPDRVVVPMEVDHQHLRPGQTVMGPVMMTLADTAAYASLLARDDGTAIDSVRYVHETRSVPVPFANILDELDPAVVVIERMHDRPYRA